MNNMPDIHLHERADILLDDYVMGTLSESDLAWMEAHIATCSVCQREIPVLVEGTYALGWSPADPPVEMSADLWDRIEANLAPTTAADEEFNVDPAWTEVGGHTTQPIIPLDLGDPPPDRTTRHDGRSTGSRWNQPRYRWLAAAAIVLVLIGVGALVGRSLWWTDQAEPAQEIALHDADGNLIAADVANLEYLPDEQRFVLHMEDMPEAPEGQVYQGWLIAGDVPIGVGIVDPVTGEFSVDGDRATYDVFAITVEPGPNGSDLPTTNPIVVAPLHDTN